VGYDETEWTRSVKYYDTETKKVLTSRNFRFVTPPEKDSQVDPEGIIVVASDTTTLKLEEESDDARGSTLRAPSGEARDGARVAGTGNAAAHWHGDCSIDNGAPSGLKRKREDLDVGESSGFAVVLGEMPQY